MSLVMLENVGAVASTNDIASAWIREGRLHGSACYTDQQLAGRGRQGRSWHSVPGESLCMSVVLTSQAIRAQPTFVPLIAAVACADAFAELFPKTDGRAGIALKWPNDLLVGDRKLGGILCEGVTNDSGFAGVVAGIGVNVALSGDGLPEALRGRVVSLAEVADRGAGDIQLGDLAGLAERVRLAVVRVAAAFEEGLEQGGAWLVGRWMAYDGTSGRRVRTASGEEGQAVGIAADGALQVLLDGGGRVDLRTGEITFIDVLE